MGYTLTYDVYEFTEDERHNGEFEYELSDEQLEQAAFDFMVNGKPRYRKIGDNFKPDERSYQLGASEVMDMIAELDLMDVTVEALLENDAFKDYLKREFKRNARSEFYMVCDND